MDIAYNIAGDFFDETSGAHERLEAAIKEAVEKAVREEREARNAVSRHATRCQERIAELEATVERQRKALQTIADEPGYGDCHIDGDPCQCTCCRFSRLAKVALSEQEGVEG